MRLKLDGIPWPPSVNNLYAGKARRYKTDQAKQFEIDFDVWVWHNLGLVREAKKLVREKVTHDNTTFLSLGLTYVVPYETLYSKQGKVKRIDVTNRIKALLDQLSGALGVDDSRFFLNSVIFLIGNDKHVNITIETTRIKGAIHGKEKKSSQEKGDKKEITQKGSRFWS